MKAQNMDNFFKDVSNLILQFIRYLKSFHLVSYRFQWKNQISEGLSH
jgi:hypothetical protein